MGLYGFRFVFEISLFSKIFEAPEACFPETLSFSVGLIDDVKEVDDVEIFLFPISFTGTILLESKATFDDVSSSLSFQIKSMKGKI